MQVLSINVGAPRTVTIGRKEVETSIFKEPIAGPVMARRENLDGDRQSDLKVHGGLDMAIYAYAVEHYEFWRTELNRPDLPWGQFGENLSVSGLLDDTVRIGEIYRVGQALLQVTQPRLPCFKLIHRMGEGPEFAKQFLESRRLGFYFRVLEEGEIQAGDAIQLFEEAPDSVTVAEMVEFTRFDRENVAGLRRVLSSRDLSSGPKGWREHVEKLIDRAEGG